MFSILADVKKMKDVQRGSFFKVVDGETPTGKPKMEQVASNPFLPLPTTQKQLNRFLADEDTKRLTKIAENVAQTEGGIAGNSFLLSAEHIATIIVSRGLVGTKESAKESAESAESIIDARSTVNV